MLLLCVRSNACPASLRTRAVMVQRVVQTCPSTTRVPLRRAIDRRQDRRRHLAAMTDTADRHCAPTSSRTTPTSPPSRPISCARWASRVVTCTRIVELGDLMEVALPHLMVVDVMLPDGDGGDITELLRTAWPGHPGGHRLGRQPRAAGRAGADRSGRGEAIRPRRLPRRGRRGPRPRHRSSAAPRDRGRGPRGLDSARPGDGHQRLALHVPPARVRRYRCSIVATARQHGAHRAVARRRQLDRPAQRLRVHLASNPCSTVMAVNTLRVLVGRLAIDGDLVASAACRFLRRMLATSIEVQPASATSSVSFGPGAAPSPSGGSASMVTSSPTRGPGLDPAAWTDRRRPRC